MESTTGGGGPLLRIFFDFGSQNGDLWCILDAIFRSLAKTLRGRKDSRAHTYCYWGGGNRPTSPRSGIEATGDNQVV